MAIKRSTLDNFDGIVRLLLAERFGDRVATDVEVNDIWEAAKATYALSDAFGDVCIEACVKRLQYSYAAGRALAR